MPDLADGDRTFAREWASAYGVTLHSVYPEITAGLRKIIRRQCEDEAENERALAEILYGPDWPGEDGVGMSVLIERAGEMVAALRAEVERLQKELTHLNSIMFSD